MRALMDYHWPGNIRELKNCLARAVILSKKSYLALEDLPRKISQKTSTPEAQSGTERSEAATSLGPTLKDMETDLIINTLKRCNGNKTLAAKVLGISRKGLYEKMERLGVRDFLDSGGEMLPMIPLRFILALFAAVLFWGLSIAAVEAARLFWGRPRL
jgi:DNA-binding NtrC family response regulator